MRFMPKRFSSYFEFLEKQNKRTRFMVLLAIVGLLLFLGLAITLPLSGILNKTFNKEASHAQTATFCGDTTTPGPLNSGSTNIAPSGVGSTWFWNSPPTGGFTSLSVPLTIENDPTYDGYYWASQFGFTGFSGGYFGLQAHGRLGKTFIFSIGDAVIKAEYGDILPPNADIQGSFDLKQGISTAARYDWVPCRTYELAMVKEGTDASGNIWWRSSIRDTVTNQTTKLARILVPGSWGNVGSSLATWAERFTGRQMTKCSDQEYGAARFGVPSANGGLASSRQSGVNSGGCPNSRFTDLGSRGVRLEMGVSSTVATPTPTSDGSWIFCANEGQTCSFTGTKQVRYGANGFYVYKVFTTSVLCSNTVFGDPAPNQVKQCHYSSSTVSTPTPTPTPITPTPTRTPTPTPPTDGSWIFCANEGQTCSFTGTKQVRYGANGFYVYKVFTTSVLCSNTVFGDPAPNQVKQCHYSSSTVSTPTPTPILPTPTRTPTPSPVVGSGTGLRGNYYGKTNFTNYKFTRIDPVINFNWGTTRINNKIGPDSYSIRWTGFVQPEYSQTYTFYVTSDDGARLWVNNQLIINNWVNQAMTEKSGTITLTAGQKYTIRLEYYENFGSAGVQFRWSSPSRTKQIIPQNRLYPQ